MLFQQILRADFDRGQKQQNSSGCHKRKGFLGFW
jgi:hypothetical protein